MRRAPVLALVLALVPVLAAPLAAAAAPGPGPGMPARLAAEPAGFQGRIPTEDSPLTGADRLARMRREGRLPDSFTQGGCRYDLAGDPAMAYYVRQCGHP